VTIAFPLQEVVSRYYCCGVTASSTAEHRAALLAETDALADLLRENEHPSEIGRSSRRTMVRQT
jgi:hypothetical protein